MRRSPRSQILVRSTLWRSAAIASSERMFCLRGLMGFDFPFEDTDGIGIEPAPDLERHGRRSSNGPLTAALIFPIVFSIEARRPTSACLSDATRKCDRYHGGAQRDQLRRHLMSFPWLEGLPRNFRKYYLPAGCLGRTYFRFAELRRRRYLFFRSCRPADHFLEPRGRRCPWGFRLSGGPMWLDNSPKSPLGSKAAFAPVGQAK